MVKNIPLEHWDVETDGLVFADGRMWTFDGPCHDWGIIEVAKDNYPELFKEILAITDCKSYEEIKENYCSTLVMGYSFSRRHHILRWNGELGAVSMDFKRETVTKKQKEILDWFIERNMIGFFYRNVIVDNV